MTVKLIHSFRGKYHFLSNFYSYPLIYDDKTYQTAEHAFQAAKTTNKYDFDKVKACSSPGEAKKIARQIKLRPDWGEVKDQVMEGVIKAKFSQPELAKKLIDTYPAELIEGNKWGDMYWGICAGIGQNKLGKILMKVRKELIELRDHQENSSS